MDECSICYGLGTFEDDWGDSVTCSMCAGWIPADEEVDAALAAAEGE